MTPKFTGDLNRRALIAGTLATAAAGRANAAAPVGAPAPWGATPSVRQLAWHKRERYGFVHFTLNTWTDKDGAMATRTRSCSTRPRSIRTRSSQRPRARG